MAPQKRGFWSSLFRKKTKTTRHSSAKKSPSSVDKSRRIGGRKSKRGLDTHPRRYPNGEHISERFKDLAEDSEWKEEKKVRRKLRDQLQERYMDAERFRYAEALDTILEVDDEDDERGEEEEEEKEKEERESLRPGALPTIQEEDTDEERVSVKEKSPQNFVGEPVCRDSGFPDDDEYDEDKWEDIIPEDEEEEEKENETTHQTSNSSDLKKDEDDWPPPVIADEDIPQEVEMGMFRSASPSPQQPPWGIFEDINFHRLEMERSERDILEQQRRRQQVKRRYERSIPTSTPTFASSLPSLMSTSALSASTVDRQIDFHFLNPRDATETRDTTIAIAGYYARRSSGTYLPTPTTEASSSSGPTAAAPGSAHTTHIRNSTIAAPQRDLVESYETSIPRRPSSLDKSRLPLSRPPSLPLPPTPVLGAAVRPPPRPASSYVSSSSSSAAAAPPPPPPAAASATPKTTPPVAKRTGYEQKRAVYFQQEALGRLEGTIPNPKFNQTAYEDWAFSSPWAFKYKDKSLFGYL